jgi:hypothetical protein
MRQFSIFCFVSLLYTPDLEAKWMKFHLGLNYYSVRWKSHSRFRLSSSSTASLLVWITRQRCRRWLAYMYSGSEDYAERFLRPVPEYVVGVVSDVDEKG